MSAELEGARKTAQTDAHLRNADEERRKVLADFMSPDYVRGNLAEYLSEWDAVHHELVVAGIMRQLMATPGTAVLCTPKATVDIEVDPGTDAGPSSFRTRQAAGDDPLRGVRELPLNPAALQSVMASVTGYGVAKFTLNVAGGVDEYLVWQNGGNWALKKSVWRRAPRS